MLKGRVAEEDLTVQIVSKSVEFNDILVVYFKNAALPMKMNILYCDELVPIYSERSSKCQSWNPWSFALAQWNRVWNAPQACS